MKKMIIALALLGLAWSGAEAKTKVKIKGEPTACTVTARKTTHHALAKKMARHPHTLVTYGKNHQVCTNHGGYYTCCVYRDKVRKWQ